MTANRYLVMLAVEFHKDDHGYRALDDISAHIYADGEDTESIVDLRIPVAGDGSIEVEVRDGQTDADRNRAVALVTAAVLAVRAHADQVHTPEEAWVMDQVMAQKSRPRPQQRGARKARQH